MALSTKPGDSARFQSISLCQSTLKFRYLWSTISSSELGYQIFNDKYVYYLFKQNCIYVQQMRGVCIHGQSF